MQIQQLRYFVAVAEAGSMSRAAKSLNISQPSISVAVKELEEELGQSLFMRGPKGVRLTSFGVIFYKSVSRIISEMNALKAPPEPSVSLCVVENNSTVLRLVNEFTELHPEVKFYITHAEREEEMDKVYDFYVHELKPQSGVGWYDWCEIIPKRFYAVLPKDDPLAEREQLYPAELADESFVFAAKGDERHYELVYFMCIESGFKPKIAAVANTELHKVTLLAGGKHCGIISSNWYETYARFPDVRLVQLENMVSEGKFYSLYYTDKTRRNPYAMAFLEYADDNAPARTDPFWQTIEEEPDEEE